MLVTLSSALLVFASASTTAAQSTVSLFLPGFDQQRLDADVVGDPEEGASATTYAISAPSDLGPDEDSGLAGQTLYYVDSGSSVSFNVAFDGAEYGGHCDVDGVSQGDDATCVVDSQTAPVPYSVMPVDVVGSMDASAYASAVSEGAAAPTSVSVNSGVDELSSGIATIFDGGGASGSQDISESMPESTGSSNSSGENGGENENEDDDDAGNSSDAVRVGSVGTAVALGSVVVGAAGAVLGL